jgi:hypothetical protein
MMPRASLHPAIRAGARTSQPHISTMTRTMDAVVR